MCKRKKPRIRNPLPPQAPVRSNQGPQRLHPHRPPQLPQPSLPTPAELRGCQQPPALLTPHAHPPPRVAAVVPPPHRRMLQPGPPCNALTRAPSHADGWGVRCCPRSRHGEPALCFSDPADHAAAGAAGSDVRVLTHIAQCWRCPSHGPKDPLLVKPG